MSVLYAEPGVVPSRPVRVAQWNGVESTWTGWDGSVWRLSHEGSGVALRAGVRGYSMPPVARFTSSSAGVAGSRFRGSRVGEREVFWPIGVYSDAGSREWFEYDRAFWKTMHPSKPGVWAVKRPDGTARYLTCRFVSDGDPTWEFAPGLVGWKHYGIYMAAEDPFWRGDPIERTWKAADEVNFFGNGGPPFFISSSSRMETARVQNPGDEEAFPTWIEYGPAESLQVGVGDRLVDVPFAVAEGRMLVVDTRPTVQTAKEIPALPVREGRTATVAEVQDWIARHADVAVNRTRELGATTKFAAIPPGQSVNLSLAMLGEGVVQVILTPLFHRAL